MSRRVCAIFGRSDGQKPFTARVVEAAGIGRLKAVHCGKCDQCNYQVSPTAGTLMHRSRFPLKEWFWAAYLVATHTPGMSATQLRRQMGFSYKTAWFLLQRLRRGMVNANRSRLRGRVAWREQVGSGWPKPNGRMKFPFVASCRRMWNWEPKLIPINGEGIPKMP